MSEPYQQISSNYFRREDVGRVFSWDEVSEIHPVRHGIYQKNGVLSSLLTDFGRINPCYPDFHGATTDIIHYTGNGRRGDQKLDAFNRAMLEATGKDLSVPLFNKLAAGKWQFLGHWQVASGVYIFEESQSRMVWKFTLKRIA